MTKEELIAYLCSVIDKYEEEEPVDDDWNPYDAYGGNMDDAYEGGFRDGKIYGQAKLATEVLKYLSTLT